MPAQSLSQRSVGPTRPTQVPLQQTPNSAGGVSIEQQTGDAGGNSVLSTSTRTNVQPPYAGSVPEGPPLPGVLQLTLADALARGLRANLAALTEDATVQQARSQRLSARSELLPTLNSAISEELERVNLRTMGVESPQFPTAVTFNFYDVRAARLEQSVFDLVRVENLHSATESVHAAMKQAKDARDLIVLAVGGTYLQLVASQARIQAAQAQVKSAQAVYQQADDRRTAGLAPAIDADRAHVQLQIEQQRLRSLQADSDTQKLRLARIIGLPLGQQFAPSEHLDYTPLTDVTEESAMARAYAGRNDTQAAAAAVRAAEHALKASRAERLPNLSITADVGAAGRTPTNNTTSVYSVAGTLAIPIFEGGRIRADIEQAAAALKLRKSQYEDARAQVDQDVRQAFIDLNAAADQVDVAKSNVDLAKRTLAQSRDRFAAGVTDTVEVVQAEQAVVQADDSFITAVYEHNLAKVALARAMGNAEQTLPHFLKKAND
jgi:outer membrane protein TolC